MMRAFAVAAVAALAIALIADASARRPRVEPGAGIDRCDERNRCTDVLTDPETCCPICGRVIVTQARRAEIEHRCARPQPLRRCRTLRCGAPRPANPVCRDGECRELGE